MNYTEILWTKMKHHTIGGNNIHEVIYNLVNLFKNSQEIQISRHNCNEKIKELQNVTINLKKPIECISNLNGIVAYPTWLQNEIMTEITAQNPPLNYYYYPERLKQFININGKQRYTYGERWKKLNQLYNVIERLKQDIYSRQAILVIYDYTDTDTREWNIPCTIFHQFIYRDGALDIIVYLRSNDFLIGFKYDVPLASFLLQLVANSLRIPVGNIIYKVTSFHYYLKDEKSFDKIATDTGECKQLILQSNYKGFSEYKSYIENLNRLIHNEKKYRTKSNQLVFKLSPKLFQTWSDNYQNHWMYLNAPK